MAKEPKPQPEGVDAPTLARLFRCDERTIRTLATAGIAVRLGRGRYALADSLGNYIVHLREQAAGRATTEGGFNPAEETAMLRREQRLLAATKRQHIEGKLLSLPEVREAWREIVQATQQLFLSLPGRARFDMPHLTGADQKQLKSICHEMLNETAFGKPNAANEPPLPAVDEAAADEGEEAA